MARQVVGRYAHGEPRDTSLVVAMSALSFGIACWCATHAVIHAWFAHAHPGPDIAHHHGFLGPLALAALTLSIAAVAVLVARAGAAGRPAIAVRATAWHRRSPVLAPVAFMATEFAEHAGGAQPLPPVTLLIVGCVLHAVAGAVSPLLWRMWLEHACRAVAVPPRPDGRRPGPAHLPSRAPTAQRISRSDGSRAPPAGTCPAFPSSLPGSA